MIGPDPLDFSELQFETVWKHCGAVIFREERGSFTFYCQSEREREREGRQDGVIITGLELD